MTNRIECTCTEAQLNAVGCDCEFSRQYDVPMLPFAVKATRAAHRQSVIQAARKDADANVDNRAAYAASSADWYAYCAEWTWACERIEAGAA